MRGLFRHPDKNKDPNAEDMFIKITKSYEVSEKASQHTCTSNSLLLYLLLGLFHFHYSGVNTTIIISLLLFSFAHRFCLMRSEGPTLTAMGRWMKTNLLAIHSIKVSAASTTVSTSMNLFSIFPGTPISSSDSFDHYGAVI